MKPGEAWGEPFSGTVDLEVCGDDRDLARVIDTHLGALVRYRPVPGSDFARSVGIADGDGSGDAGDAHRRLAGTVDALRLEPGGLAVNGVVLGPPPGRIRATTPSAHVRVVVDGRVVADGKATTVVVANGQFFDGLDVVPRGHPGDGRAEVQVYGLRRGERRAMRGRLPQGVHLPHPRITTSTGRRVEIHVEHGNPELIVDGVQRAAVTHLTVSVVPGALRLVL